MPMGDQALVIEFGNQIEPECNARVHSLTRALDLSTPIGVVAVIPTYRSLTIQYDANLIGYKDLTNQLRDIDVNSNAHEILTNRIVHLPTIYGLEFGPDLEFVARHSELSAEEVIRVHSATDYLVYMMGFTPGFPYLGGMSEEIATPRLETPRNSIPAGSVGIAESQTGVYPIDTPGGWRILGRTPLKLFDTSRERPSLIAAGDYVRFVPLSNKDEYQMIEEQIMKGEYKPTVTTE